jgi:hypothetical protein
MIGFSHSPHPKHREEPPKNTQNYNLGRVRRTIDEINERRKFNQEFKYLD